MQSGLHKLGSSPPCRLLVGPGRRWFATAQPDHQTLIGAARDGLNHLRCARKKPGGGGSNDLKQSRNLRKEPCREKALPGSGWSPAGTESCVERGRPRLRSVDREHAGRGIELREIYTSGGKRRPRQRIERVNDDRDTELGNHLHET